MRHDLVSSMKTAGDEIVYPHAVLSCGVAAREAVLANADTDGTRAALQAVFDVYDEADNFSHAVDAVDQLLCVHNVTQ